MLRLGAGRSAYTWHSEHGSTIDCENGASDASCITPRCEKHIGARKIIGVQGEAQRIAAAEALLDGRIGELRAVVIAQCCESAKVGHGAAGRDAVDPDNRRTAPATQIRLVERLMFHNPDRLVTWLKPSAVRPDACRSVSCPAPRVPWCAD